MCKRCFTFVENLLDARQLDHYSSKLDPSPPRCNPHSRARDSMAPLAASFMAAVELNHKKYHLTTQSDWKPEAARTLCTPPRLAHNARVPFNSPTPS